MKRILFLGILLSVFCIAFMPVKTIQGIVTDEKGNPVSGASVAIKGTNKATVTDIKGAFSITVPDEETVLVVSFVGYESMEVKISGTENLTIKLNPSIQRLQEVVVVGYGTKLKKNITSSIVSYNDVLAGKASGIVFSSPGVASNIRIRGTASRNAYFTTTKEYEGDGEEDEYNDWRYNNDFNTEGYDHITENPFLKVNDNPLSTFSIDVDAASYSNMRRFISNGQLPPAGAIRIEELINMCNAHGMKIMNWYWLVYRERKYQQKIYRLLTLCS
jgi:Ca-activated chloride channel homolog